MIEFLYSRAHRWAVIGRYEKAEPIFRILCMFDGESADFWAGFGICLKARSAFDEALAAFRMLPLHKVNCIIENIIDFGNACPTFRRSFPTAVQA